MVSEKNVHEGLLPFKSRCEKVLVLALAVALAAFVQIVVYSSSVINFPSNCSMCVNSRHERLFTRMCCRTVSREPLRLPMRMCSGIVSFLTSRRQAMTETAPDRNHEL